ncbi:ATP-binding protein [Parasediminibacterium sp. JCM 36343]|uniref:tetratricopeptide repeat-containing sensor histidine kinase n=1 Tax=Parasediminibacterium sp. JCM 36343 TaxID=3374279 RepID=UPI003978AE7A
MLLKIQLIVVLLAIGISGGYAQKNSKDTAIKSFIRSINDKADEYMNQGKYDSSVALMLGILNNENVSGINKVKTCLRIAGTYQQVGSTSMMDLYLSKAKQLADNMHTPAMDSLYIGAYCFFKANIYNTSKRYDSASYFAKKGLPYFMDPQYKQTSFVPILYEILGRSVYNLDKKNFKQALAYYDSAMAHIDSSFDTHYYNVFLNKAQTLKDNKAYKAALHIFLTVYKAKAIQDQSGELLWAAQGATGCYEHLHDFANAVYYSKKVNELTEKLYGPTQLEGFKKAEIEYREKENKALATINTQQQAIVKARQNQLIVALAALALIAIGAVLLYQNRQQLNNQKKLAEQQSLQLQQLDAINKKVFATISHDLNSPLLTLESLFEIMGMEDGRDTDNIFYQDVRQQLNSCSQVLQNLLQWSKSELGHEITTNASVDVYKAMDELLAQNNYLIKPKQLDVQISSSNERLSVAIPEEIFKIVCRNVLSNAIKFSPLGSIIKIECFMQGSIPIVSFTNKGQLPETLIKQLFSGVVTGTKGTNYETGYGLGLYITAQLMQKAHGRISAMNNKDNTCTFVLQFTTAHAVDSTIG